MTSKLTDQKVTALDSGPAAQSASAPGKATEQARAQLADGNTSDAGNKAPQALDRWFDDQLNRLFNDVSSEPLPADLAKLIGQLKSQDGK